MGTGGFHTTTLGLAVVAVALELGAADWTVTSSGTQSVGADAAYGAIAVDAPSVTFDVAPGAAVSANAMTVKSTAGAAAFTLSGGGTLSLDDKPFNIGDGANPVAFTVAGAGTTFVMPKTAASGLYIGQVGQLEQSRGTVESVFHVTDGARAVISNAVSVGVGYRPDGTTVVGRGRLLVDGGASLHGGAIFFAGRGDANVTALTNATLEVADQITTGDGEWHRFTASNATLRATGPYSSFTFPYTLNGRFQRVAFTDSVLSMRNLNVGYCGRGNTGRLDRCTLDVENLVSGQKAAWHSSFTLTDCMFTSRFRDLSSGGASNASNCVLRLVRTPVAGAGSVRVNVGGTDSETTTIRIEDCDLAVLSLILGTKPDANYSHHPRYEQRGGSFSASEEVNVGKYVSDGAVAELRGVTSFSAPKIICGDSGGSSGPRFVLADTPANATARRLWVGNAASGAQVHVTKAVLDVVYPDSDASVNLTAVGRAAGAVSNELLVEDGALRQTGGHFYVGHNASATGNVLRLVRATCSYATVGGKGDFAVGLDGAFNRVVMTNAVFRYDRRFLAIGQNATATDNAWVLAEGSRLEAADAQLHVGYRGARNRLALLGGAAVNVRKLSLVNAATLEVAGSGNVVTVGNEDYSLTDGCAFRFAPPAAASETPMLTIDRNLGFSATRKLTVDFAGAGFGTHVLVASSVAQNVPEKGVNVVLANVAPNTAARVWRSADGMQVVCSLAPRGIAIIVR